MRTTVTLDERLLRELLDLSGERSKTAAVRAAVVEQIRRAKLRKLAGLLGHIQVEEAALAAHERADRGRDRLLRKRGTEHARRA
jgi:hypothetical protein